MKALVLLNAREESRMDSVRSVMADQPVGFDILVFDPPFNVRCSQQDEIIQLVDVADVIIYFASIDSEENVCLDIALTEAARTNTKVICICDDEGVVPGATFERFGDVLVGGVSELAGVVLGAAVSDDWVNPDGSLRDDRPFKRYKCK